MWRHPARGRGPGNSVLGFTLMEILVVLIILSVIIGVGLPNLMPDNRQAVRQEAVRFRNVLQWLAEQAAYGSGKYRLRLDFAKQSYVCLVLFEKEYKEVDDPLVKKRFLDNDRVVMRWKPYENEFTSQHEIDVDFTPFGPSRPLMVEFFLPENDRFGYWVEFSPNRPFPSVREIESEK